MRCRFLYRLEFFWKVFFWTYFLCSISKWSDPGRFPFPQSKGVPVNVLISVGVFFETFFKMPVKISQYCGTVGLLNSRSIVNRSKVNSFVTSKYRNNTYIACSLVFVNILFLTLFSVLFFLKDNVSKNNKQFLVSILFSSTILSIPFVLFFSLLVSFSGDVEVNSGLNHKLNETLLICCWNLNSISA